MLTGRAEAKEQMEEKTPSVVKKSRTVTAAWASLPSETGEHQCGHVLGLVFSPVGGEEQV